MVLTRILVLPGWDGERLQTLPRSRRLPQALSYYHACGSHRRFRIQRFLVRCKRAGCRSGRGPGLATAQGGGRGLAAAQGGGRWGKPKAIFAYVTIAWWLDGFIEEKGTLQEEGELVREGSGCNTA
jgi:hypothetical protein